MLYLDHAATSPTRPEVIEALGRDLARPLNASSVHHAGQRAQALLEQAREEIADLLGVTAPEILFTASATEANNLALRGFAKSFTRRAGRPPRIATSVLEHSCIRETARDLAASGHAVVDWFKVATNGQVLLPESLDADILTLPAVQNETGVIQRLGDARKLRLQSGTRWLCDMTQALATEAINLRDLGADLCSMASHKVGGPPGVGVLAGPGLREIGPLLTGGPQEGELRAGTQPVALVRGFALALRLATGERESLRAHLAELETIFLQVLRERGVPFQHNGDGAPRAPGFINLSIPGISGPDLVIALDARGIATSSGSACATGVMETSEALAAMFPGDAARAGGALRLTPGRNTTSAEMQIAAMTLAEIIGK